MSKDKKPPAHRGLGLPDKETLRQYILDNPNALHKRDIARAFGIKGQDKMQLRKLLRLMAEEGVIEKESGKLFKAPAPKGTDKNQGGYSSNELPESAMIEIIGLDDDGELCAKPADWLGKGRPPVIYVTDRKNAGVKTGDLVLARLKKTDGNAYQARILKALEATSPGRMIGIFKSYKDSGFVTPTNKKDREEYLVPPEHVDGTEDGELVLIERLPPSSKYPKSKNPSRIIERLGKKDDPKLISLIAIHSQGIPTEFSKETLKEAEVLKEPDLSGGRVDMRQIPLVTIDGADARDFDDAVFAEQDTDPKNPGGWKLIVAIADVSYYVRPGSALDKDAYERGNSTYFADRVVPMLPERLSNDLCSLRPLVNRACLAVYMTLDKEARMIDFRFVRGLMRSAARLTYEQVQEAQDGKPDDTTAPLLDLVIRPLYKAYSLLKHAREKRGALELDLPERKAIIKNGVVTAIVPRARLASHQLIEEFMILANVAAAEELERKNAPCIYRVHDQPSFDRIEATREFLKELGYSLPKTDQLHPKNINHILKISSERGDAPLIHTMLLRTQSQAVYQPENNGHFGLALEKYAHFTSPIRRYADLIVHRSLVTAGKLGDGGISTHETENLFSIAEHISQTERRSMLAERDVMDRFTAQYLMAHIGKDFQGRISGVTHFGLFVTLDESGADGILPIRQLPRDYYVHDEAHHALVGKNTGRTYRLSDPIIVSLLEADPMRGSTVFSIAGGGGDSMPAPRHGRKEKPQKFRRDKGRDDGRGGGGGKRRADGKRDKKRRK